MNPNLWITPGIIISCRYKRELYKELYNNNNDNDTLASYYSDYSKTTVCVYKKGKNN
jgi:hypothetical protein